MPRCTWLEPQYCRAVVCIESKQRLLRLAVVVSWQRVFVRNMAWSDMAWQLDVSNTRWSSVGTVWTHAACHGERVWRSHETTRPRRTTVLYGQLVGTTSHPAPVTFIATLRPPCGYLSTLFFVVAKSAGHDKSNVGRTANDVRCRKFNWEKNCWNVDTEINGFLHFQAFQPQYYQLYIFDLHSLFFDVCFTFLHFLVLCWFAPFL